MPPRRYSRHIFTSGLIDDDDDRIYLTDREPFTFRDRDDNIQHTVNEGDTLYALADQFYPDLPRAAGLYWVIADYQPDPIHDPTLRLEPGRLLFAPSQRVVIEELFDEERADE